MLSAGNQVMSTGVPSSLLAMSATRSARHLIIVGRVCAARCPGSSLPSMANAELEELIVADAEALRVWLLDHHTTSAGVWLALTRKGGTVTTLTWQQAVDEALCAGWIDGQGRKGDAETSWIRFTPRRSRSSWSRRNVEHVARLEEQGRMLPAGRAAVEAAKADGRWAAAYAPPSEAEVPDDLKAAIAAEPAAQAMFDVLTKSNRFALIYRVNAVKRAETRERKIGEFVAMLARHETIHPQKARPQPSPQ
ncbi:hypothetical protein Areg01_66740 [Actinoplanes regularis]|nr:hypothetical protein Areg01_66740 [Actinoplanes regularis]